MTTFQKNHPEYTRIRSHIERARAERALAIGEAIGNALVTLTRVVQGWRVLFAPRARKAA